MELLRAYSNKVAGYMPRNIRQDAADELYDSLCEQYEDSGADFAEKNELEFLSRQPSPIRMATQMSDNESLYLIGPALYLSFIEAIKIAAIIVGVIHLGLFGLAALSSGTVMQAFLQTLAKFPGAYLDVLAIILIVFIVLQRAGEKANWLEKWSVKDLQQELGKDKISRFETLFELNISALVFMWLLNIIQLPSVVRHDDIWLNNLTAEIPDSLITLMLLTLGADILVSIYKLFHSFWSSTLRLVAIALDLASIAILLVLIRIDPLVTQDTLPGVPQINDVLGLLNNVINIGLTIAVIVISWDAIGHITRLLKKLWKTARTTA